jgi:hypothetical protein
LEVLMRHVAFIACGGVLSFLAGCGTGGGASPPIDAPTSTKPDVSNPSPVDTAVNIPSPTVDAAVEASVAMEVASGGDDTREGGPPVTMPDGSSPEPAGLSYKDFSCSWVLGIHTTSEWYNAGFENVVDNARWQCSGIEMAQFNWAQPGSGLWDQAPASPCTTNSKTPDRIVFSGVDSASTTVAQFLPQYLSVINIIKTRFPSVKRVDLMTLARAPGDVECKGANRSNSSWIKPAQDEAIAMTAAMFPGFVFVLPKWEVKACSDFGLCPHISAAANADLAKTMGDYFVAH